MHFLLLCLKLFYFIVSRKLFLFLLKYHILGIGPMGPLAPIAGPQSFMDLASQGFPPLPPPIPLPGMNDSPLEFSTNKNQPPVVREAPEDNSDKRNEKSDIRRERENRDNRDTRDNRRFF